MQPEKPGALLPAWVLDFLAGVGIYDPTPENKLHDIAVNCAMNVGERGTKQEFLVQMILAVGQEMEDARQAHAQAKLNAEHAQARFMLPLLAEKMAHNKALIMAEADEELFELWLQVPVAENRFRVAKTLWDSIDRALSAWQTTAKTQYRSDYVQAQGYAGGG